MDLIFVRPRDGLAMRMPDGRPLPAEGAEVPRDLFWARRIADGDVAEVPPAKPTSRKGADA